MNGSGGNGAWDDREVRRARRAAMEDRRRHLDTMLTVRWVLVGVTGLLAAAILASGGWVIGSLLAFVAAARVVMLTTIERRRRDWRRRYGPGAGATGATGATGSPAEPIDV